MRDLRLSGLWCPRMTDMKDRGTWQDALQDLGAATDRVRELEAEVEALLKPTYSEDGRYLVAESMAHSKLWELVQKVKADRDQWERRAKRYEEGLRGVLDALGPSRHFPKTADVIRRILEERDDG